jgi:DNA alkylation damage repair protein AlkB
MSGKVDDEPTASDDGREGSLHPPSPLPPSPQMADIARDHARDAWGGGNDDRTTTTTTRRRTRIRGRGRRQRQRGCSDNSLLLLPDCHIGIVGGGLAGLASALAILRSFSSSRSTGGASDDNDDDGSPPHFGGRITIYERDTTQDERKEGYGMTLTYDPVGPLSELGILENVASVDCPSRCHYTFDGAGNVRGYFGNAFDGGGGGQRGNMRIPRSGLRSILINELLATASDAVAAPASIRASPGADDADAYESSIVRILWNKRLSSYVDAPMTERINAIRGRRRGDDVGGEDNDEDDYDEVEDDPRHRRRPVLLRFDDGTTDRVDLLIGADGVNSVVARQYLSTSVPSASIGSTSKIDTTGSPEGSFESASRSSPSPSSPTPRHLDVFIILGISDHYHPFIDERGFYTLDGTHRLFIMPFQGSRLDDVVADDEDDNDDHRNDDGATTTRRRGMTRKTMWQLSFPVSDRNEAANLRRLSNTEAMRKEVLRRCSDFHEPFPDMVRNTPISTIWGTPLLDRDPMEFLTHRASLEAHGRLPSRVVLLGDAAHPMSPFKGQGANQALADGVLLGQWLRRSRPESAVRGFMTEMARRSATKVRASREAAKRLHSENCWEWLVDQQQQQSKCLPFHGVQTKHVSTLLRTLRERGVGAHLGSQLDDVIRAVIRELNIAEIHDTREDVDVQLLPDNADIADAILREASLQQQRRQQQLMYQSQALDYASTGNMSGLRQLSRKSNLIIPKALDVNTQRRCLHLAAMNGHVGVCRWLLSEVNVDVDSLDADGKKAVDLAADAGNCQDTVRLLKRWSRNQPKPEQQSCEKNGRCDSGAMTSYMSDILNSINQDEGVFATTTGSVEKDVYRHFEQQLRKVHTATELRSLLRKNRDSLSHPTNEDNYLVTHVLGCHLVDGDIEHDDHCRKVLAERHGAVLLRNFIPREIDQLALGALALRPLKIDLPHALSNLHAPCGPIGSHKMSMSVSEKKQMCKLHEDVKSRVFIPARASVIAQTNFGPQMQSDLSIEKDRPKKQRKINALPLSKLRYVNLGEWNYNWHDRLYEKVQNAMAFPDRLVSLAQHAHDIAKCLSNTVSAAPPISFDMAICNVYHLQRPSDRLGGHQDDVESDLSLPLVTVSLGSPGIFLLGGRSRQVVPTAILLRAGDCMVMSGNSRRFFHGVPSVLSNELDDNRGCCDCLSRDNHCIFPEYNKNGTLILNADKDYLSIPSLDELRFAEAFLSTVRMNISIRKV